MSHGDGAFWWDVLWVFAFTFLVEIIQFNWYSSWTVRVLVGWCTVQQMHFLTL